MRSLNRKTDYALAALTDLAKSNNGGASARDLSQRLQLPLRALTNILNQLKHRGLVSSIRGARGGYRLARNAKDISLAEVIEGVQGPIRLTLCCSDPRDEENGDCDREELCEVKDSMRIVHAGLRASLGRISLEDIARKQVTWRTDPGRPG